ncbi:DNA-3-methyladenine glycosylase I [Desulfobacterales bacterium HSG16]|nr:DNA-3-methyladenine glycosylase I [Desulfobacterales bacterium HSG16]
MADSKKYRCEWAGCDPLYIEYHDTQWGVPVHDDRTLFEFLLLEGVQAGLSWITVLRKRENYRQAFNSFDPEQIVLYDTKKIESLMENPGIIRNKGKIKAAIVNAEAFLEVLVKFGSFDRYIWQFTDGEPIINAWRTIEEIPAKTAISETMSCDLKQRGFKFVGPVICYAYMQAVGMVNDHLTRCFRYDILSN